MIKQFHFSSGREKLAAISFVNSDEQPRGLLLHGAGQSSKERRQYLMEHLLSRGVASMAFDFSGCGQSTGVFEQSSLQKRVQEGKLALSLVAYQNRGFILGASMGAYIAVRLTESFNVPALVLFAPAMYDVEAFDKPFEKGF